MQNSKSPNARTVVANPHLFYRAPLVLATAWITLKAERGQNVHMDHVGEPAYRIEADSPAPTADAASLRSRRVSRRIADHIAQKAEGAA